MTVLRASHANYDLSSVDGTHRVVVDDGQPPPIRAPWVVLGAPAVEVMHDAVTPLSQYRVRGLIPWWAFVATNAETTESRAFAACDLASDVIQAIQTAHASGLYTIIGELHLLMPSRTVQVFGDASVGGMPYGVAQGEIVYEAFVSGGI